VDPRVRTIRAGEEFLPGLTAHAAPGHTPGSLVFNLTSNPVPVIFTGDAAKNRAELLSREVDMSEDRAASKASIETIWRLWRSQPGSILVPGHDLSMRLDENGIPHYIGRRIAGISAWFSETLEQTTEFDFGAKAP
jgi:N-acyl homoserine lactone hydrolase